MQVNLEFVYDLTPQMIDEMIDAMRAGTYQTKPMAQTEKPGAHVDGHAGLASRARAENRPARAARRCRTMRAASAIASGIIMLDRF